MEKRANRARKRSYSNENQLQRRRAVQGDGEAVSKDGIGELLEGLGLSPLGLGRACGVEGNGDCRDDGIEQNGFSGGEKLVPMCRHREIVMPLHAIAWLLVFVYHVEGYPWNSILQCIDSAWHSFCWVKSYNRRTWLVVCLCFVERYGVFIWYGSCDHPITQYPLNFGVKLDRNDWIVRRGYPIRSVCKGR